MKSVFSEGRALIVGVGGDLPSTVDDARGLAEILKDPERCAYAPDQVELLTGAAAGRSGMLTGLDRLAKGADEKSTAIIYFSGHGYYVKSSISDAYYLMPFGYNVEQLRDTAISGSEFADKLKAIKAQKLLLLLDCCHAGGFADMKAPGLQFTKAPLPPEAQSLFAQGRGRVVIASSQADELSYAGKPYSAFTLALIDALCGAGASRKDGFVRVTDLALHTREMVPGKTKDRQHPIMDFNQSDNFVLAYYAGGEKEPKGLPFQEEPEIEPEPGTWSRVSSFDQRHQRIYGPQTNIAGNVQGPVFSGRFSGPVSTGGDAIDMRGSTGTIFKPTGPISQHIGDRIEIRREGNIVRPGTSLKVAAIEEFLEELQSLRRALESADLDRDTVEAVNADLKIVQAQAKKERPNKTMIMSKLRSASEILDSAEGAEGTIEQVQTMASALLRSAEGLFA